MGSMENIYNNPTNSYETKASTVVNIIYVSKDIFKDIFSLGKELLRCRSVQEIQDTLGPPDPR